MEIVDIVDKRGMPTGEQVEREQAHTLGIRHRTSHVWIVRRKDGRLQVLLQKRSENKDSFPGCYDISSAGHIPAGVDFVSSAIRELKEELGCEVKPEELIYCGQRCFEFQDTFHGKVFHDNQVSNVYALWLDMEPETFSLQKEEVSEVKWFDFQECLEKVEKNEIPNCIFSEELKMVEIVANTGIKGIVLQEIRELARKYDVNKVILFGSRARGDFRRTSDIDLASEGGDQTRFALDVDDQTSTLLKFDIINLDGVVQKELLDSIEKEGIVIYEKI